MMVSSFDLLRNVRRESPKLSTSYKIMVNCKQMQNCFLCEMNSAVFSVRVFGEAIDSRLYSVSVTGALPSPRNEIPFLVFRS
jgi:hypothetical protein